MVNILYFWANIRRYRSESNIYLKVTHVFWNTQKEPLTKPNYSSLCMNERKINEFCKQFLGMCVCVYSSNEHFTSTELNLGKIIENIHFTTFFDFKRQQISRHASKETHLLYFDTHTLLRYVHIWIVRKMFKVVSKLIQNGIWWSENLAVDGVH